MYSTAIRRCLVSARGRCSSALPASARIAASTHPGLGSSSIRYYRAAAPLHSSGSSDNNDDDMNRINSSISNIISNNITENSDDNNDATSSDLNVSMDETTHDDSAVDETAVDDSTTDSIAVDDAFVDASEVATDHDDSTDNSLDAALNDTDIDASEVATSHDDSTADTTSDDRNDMNKPVYATGTVKFYHRQRLFGFVTMDKAPRGTPDIFVKRSQIRSTLDFEYSPRNPFLIRGDRIRFVLEEVDGQLRAMDVTALDRRPIPPLRHSYWRNKTNGLYRQLGEDVDTILTHSPDDQWQRIQDAWKVHRARLEDASVLMERLGMRKEDFAAEKENKTLKDGGNEVIMWKEDQ
jgi:cold shock CspA family protein